MMKKLHKKFCITTWTTFSEKNDNIIVRFIFLNIEHAEFQTPIELSLITSMHNSFKISFFFSIYYLCFNVYILISCILCLAVIFFIGNVCVVNKFSSIILKEHCHLFILFSDLILFIKILLK